MDCVCIVSASFHHWKVVVATTINPCSSDTAIPVTSNLKKADSFRFGYSPARSRVSKMAISYEYRTLLVSRANDPDSATTQS